MAAAEAACRVQVGSAVGRGERQGEGLHAEGGAQDGAGRGGDAAGGLRRGLAAHAGFLHGYSSSSLFSPSGHLHLSGDLFLSLMCC